MKQCSLLLSFSHVLSFCLYVMKVSSQVYRKLIFGRSCVLRKKDFQVWNYKIILHVCAWDKCNEYWSGCFLCCGCSADDMGLGKTLTMISLILKHKEALSGGEKGRNQKAWQKREEQLKKCEHQHRFLVASVWCITSEAHISKCIVTYVQD